MVNVFRSEYTDVQPLGLPIHDAVLGKILRRELRDREKADEKVSERTEEA
ncbi:hypothetical protein [Streptomyces sp. NBC_00842]|nr:hypothetical protein OH821_25030 [Streptomyces sp. NBC_00842]